MYDFFVSLSLCGVIFYVQPTIATNNFADTKNALQAVLCLGRQNVQVRHTRKS